MCTLMYRIDYKRRENSRGCSEIPNGLADTFTINHLKIYILKKRKSTTINTMERSNALLSKC